MPMNAFESSSSFSNPGFVINIRMDVTVFMAKRRCSTAHSFQYFKIEEIFLIIKIHQLTTLKGVIIKVQNLLESETKIISKIENIYERPGLNLKD